MEAQAVKAYAEPQKNDFNDAEAIAEAVTRPTMRFVAVKTVHQQNLRCVHRARQGLVENRTALVNQICGFLLEYGVVVPKGIRVLHTALPELLEGADNALTPVVRALLDRLARQWQVLDLGGCLFDRVTPAMTIYREGIFGPVLGVVRVPTLQEAMGLIDAHEYGNGTCLFTRDGIEGGPPASAAVLSFVANPT